MNVIICDICKKSLDGDAYELHFIRGRVVPASQGTAKMIRRGDGQMIFLCHACGDWIDRAIVHLRSELAPGGAPLS